MTEDLSTFIICEKCGHKNKKNGTNCTHCGNLLYRDYYKGLWLKNIVITLGLFLLPFIILYYFVSSQATRHSENQVKQQLSYSIDVNTSIIQSFLDERKTDLLSIAKFDLDNLDEIGSKTLFLQSFVAEKPWFDFIAVANVRGIVIFSTDTLKLRANIQDRIYFKKSLKGDYYNSGVFYSDILDTTAMIISSPLYSKDNKILGVIFSSISLKTFYDVILELRIGRTSEIFLVDENGIFLSPSRLGGEVLEEHGHYREDPNPHIGQKDILIHRDYRGEKVICAYEKFDELHGYLVSEMDVEEALAPVIRLKNVMFSIFLIFGCILVLSSILFSRQITNILKNLTRTLKASLDDINKKKNTINTINVELRERLRDCESLGNQLRISEEYIRNIINSISSGLVAIDKDRNITYCNDFVKTFSVKQEIRMNSGLYENFPIFKNEDIKNQINSIFSNKKPFRIRKIPLVYDGNTIILSIAGFPIMTTNEITGATLLINDITEQEQLHAQLADYEKLSALSQLALGAAHEINNPLLGITTYIELLLEEENNVDKKSRAKEVLESANRISETIRGLLNYARPTPPKFTKISLNKLISETLSFLQHQPLFRKVTIEQTLSDAVPQITADVNQIRQVLTNIFINAAQSMPTGGKLTVITRKVKFREYVEVIIIDTGTGIPAEHLKSVFEPFFTTKKGGGTGLGLSISYSYVKNHNGVITVSSELDKGTQVTIMLPIRQKTKIKSEVVK